MAESVKWSLFLSFNLKSRLNITKFLFSQGTVRGHTESDPY